MAARLLLVPVLDLRLAGDRLHVRDFRRLEFQLHPELALHPLDRNLYVDVPQASQQQLTCFDLPLDAEARVLFADPGQGSRDLVHVCLGLRVCSHLVDRRREREGRQVDGFAALGQRVACQYRRELCNCADVAGRERGDRLLLLAGQHVDLTDALGLASGSIPYLLVAREFPADDTDVRKLAHKRVRGRLEHLGGQRAPSVGRQRDLSVPRRSLHRLSLGRRRHGVHYQVHRFRCADAGARRAEQHGHYVARGDTLPESLGDLGIRKLLALQVLHHQVVVRLCYGFDQLLPVLVVGVPHFVRNAAAVSQQADYPGEACLGSVRNLDCQAFAPEDFRECVQGALVADVLTVHLVDEDGARKLKLIGHPPHLQRAHLHAGGGIHDDDRRLGYSYGRAHLPAVISVARRVHHVYLASLPGAGQHRGLDARSPLLLLGLVVRRGVFVVGLAEPVDDAGREQHGLRQHGLAGPAVGQEHDITQVLCIDFRHRASPPGIRSTG